MKHFLRKVLTLKIYPGVCVGGGGGGGVSGKMKTRSNLGNFPEQI